MNKNVAEKKVMEFNLLKGDSGTESSKSQIEFDINQLEEINNFINNKKLFKNYLFNH